MSDMADVVNRFYERLGERNWIFHDVLSLDEVRALLDETDDAETAERRLIELYQDEDKTKFWMMRLRNQEGLRQRSNQIDRAYDHYKAGQFDSCVLHLIAVMDGFVGDFQPGERKGLHARDPDDVVAWDSVVGHHLGLSHALKTFLKPIYKRVDSEFEVHRHGVMHGAIVKFDNVVVATKAWNMLFAVADWATATTKAAKPKEPDPSWSDTWSRVKRNAEYKRHSKDFVASTLTPDDAEFGEVDVVRLAGEFLEAWQHGRWGLVARFTPPLLLGSKSEKQAARFSKDVFEQYNLTSFELTAVTFDQASSAEIRSLVTVSDTTSEIRFRLVLWTSDGNVGMPGDDDATWRLAVWAPHTFFK